MVQSRMPRVPTSGTAVAPTAICHFRGMALKRRSGRPAKAVTRCRDRFARARTRCSQSAAGLASRGPRGGAAGGADDFCFDGCGDRGVGAVAGRERPGGGDSSGALAGARLGGSGGGASGAAAEGGWGEGAAPVGRSRSGAGTSGDGRSGRSNTHSQRGHFPCFPAQWSSRRRRVPHRAHCTSNTARLNSDSRRR